MLNDLRLAVRMLLKQSGFTTITVLTLALGIGATAAVFSLIQGVLLTPPPYRQPERLMLIPAARADGRQAAQARSWPATQWMEWRKEGKSFEEIAAYHWSFNFLVLDGGSQSMQGMAVTKDYFRVLGVKPLLGHTFTATEALDVSTVRQPVIILGYDLWQRTFHGDRNIVGKSVRMSRRETPPVVVGVMPAGIRFLPSPGAAQEPNYDVNAPVDFWLPATPDPRSMKGADWDVVGRLRGDATKEQAQGELTVITARQAQADHDFAGVIPRLQPLTEEMNRDGRRILIPLLGAAALVLLIACGNAGALLLVRGLRRQQEYAVRIALGVSRKALFRQVSAESLLLALLGGTLGVALAFGAVRIFRQIGGHAVPRLDAVTAGWQVLACGFGAAIFAALLAGMLPAVRASRLDPMEVMKSAGPRSSASKAEGRLLRGVTMFQTALTLALMVGAGLLVRTLINLSNVQSGYDISHLLTMTVTSIQGDYLDFHRRALDRVSALPGVQGAAFAWGVPLTGNSWPGNVDLEGQPEPTKASDRLSMPLRSVTPGYFKLLGLAITDGRDFRSTDDRKAPQIAVVNQALADRYYPHASPVGRKFWFGPRNEKSIEIAGVVANGRTADLTQPAEPEIYLPLWQASAFSKDMVIRTSADPRSVIATVQKELRAISPTAAVEHVRTLDQVRGDSLASRTFAMQLLAAFAVVGTVLTLVGIYGLLSLSVASRTRELAIRTAVGAGQSSIRNLILAEGFRLIAGGVVAGLLAAVAVSRVLRSFLFGVESTDPVTFAAVGVLFTAVAVLAFLIPARRAAKVDPLEALRYE